MTNNVNFAGGQKVERHQTIGELSEQNANDKAHQNIAPMVAIVTDTAIANIEGDVAQHQHTQKSNHDWNFGQLIDHHHRQVEHCVGGQRAVTREKAQTALPSSIVIVCPRTGTVHQIQSDIQMTYIWMMTCWIQLPCPAESGEIGPAIVEVIWTKTTGVALGEEG